MKFISFVFLISVFTILACKNQPPEKSESKLIEYPVPFYFYDDALDTDVFYGIETEKFILIHGFSSVWLLYDKRIKTEPLYNFVGLDEYIFIQSDLETQLKDLLEIRKYNERFINLQTFPWKQ